MGFFEFLSQRPARGANIQEDKSVLQVTNVTSLGERKRVWRSVTFFATVTRLSTEQTSVRFSPCRGRQMIGQDPSRPFALSGGHPTRRFQGQQEEKIYLIIITITVKSCFFGKRTTNIDNDTTMHSPTPERERWLAKVESALRMFDTLGLSREQTF